MPGRWFSTTAGCFLEYESLLERDWMLLMDFDREVQWICEQPLRLRYSTDGEPVSHVPDLLVWRDGVPYPAAYRASGPDATGTHNRPLITAAPQIDKSRTREASTKRRRSCCPPQQPKNAL